ncbi:hypothetical protein QOZ80_9BG0713560 [Eleusine coracana subsp. coracana]|nr:hypothetical protein QOZ80_9BG0713560 [Eleusine coracana subsp. coracana]
MGDLANEIEQLERVLFDTRAEPIKISYSVIKSITKGFAQVIGTGGFGVVYLGGLQNGLVAVKKIASKDLSDKEFLDEVTCLRKSLVAEEKRLLCFEYVPNGNLQHYLKEKTHGYEWDTRYQIIKGICRGLHYLHEERIYHLDLKPANVLLGARMEPKITDFGLSRCIDTQQSTIFTINFFGTLGYLAPEFIDQRQISFKSDIFSLGIILIRMLSGNTEDITDNWHESVDVLQCPQVQVCIEVAQSCIDRDPRRRPTISEIIRRLDETETIVQNIPSVISEPVNDPESSLYQVVQRFQQLSTQTVQTRMGGIYAELNLLEHILSGTQKPSNMSSSLLQLITENFSDDRIIGRGGAANVYKGIVQTGMVAVKKLHNAMHISESAFQREIEISMMTEHQNIVRFLGYCSYTEQRAFETKGKFIMADIRERLLCFEYIRNGTLYDHLTDELRGHEWNTRYEILKGICEGIYHLHEEKHVIYLGIKPANILLTDHLVPKLIDFGESRHEDESAPSDIHLYSLGYMAPESMDNGIVSAKSDIYSLGIIIFELVTGKNEEPRVNNVAGISIRT